MINVSLPTGARIHLRPGPSRQLTSCASDRVLSTALLDYYMTLKSFSQSDRYKNHKSGELRERHAAMAASPHINGIATGHVVSVGDHVYVQEQEQSIHSEMAKQTVCTLPTTELMP